MLKLMNTKTQMTYTSPTLAAITATLFLLWGAPVLAAVSADEAAKLGKELTPIGAEQAANADGNIPAWEGGITEAPAAYKGDRRYINPYKDDEPLLEINGQNFKEHAERLTEGQQALFGQYASTYKIKIFPTRRSSAYPQYIYDETIKNATRVELTNEGNGFSGTVAGHPFPIPKQGIEVMWNHMTRYNTKGYKGYFNNAIVDPSGDFIKERTYIEIAFRYNHPDTTLDNFENMALYGLIKTVAPASKVGDSYLLHLPLDRTEDDTNLWVLNRGIGKVRRIGEVGYDNPLDADYPITHDQVDMFNGPFDRYQFKLLGKKEIYVPYNAYDLYSYDLEYEEIILKGHPNTDLLRHELHRVWVIEANVRPEFKHIYNKRVFYADEDSWQILLQDMYDARGEFWRTAASFPINVYEIPAQFSGLQAHYDLQSRSYVMLYMPQGEKKPVEYDWFKAPKYFNPNTLRKFAKKAH